MTDRCTGSQERVLKEIRTELDVCDGSVITIEDCSSFPTFRRFFLEDVYLCIKRTGSQYSSPERVTEPDFCYVPAMSLQCLNKFPFFMPGLPLVDINRPIDRRGSQKRSVCIYFNVSDEIFVASFDQCGGMTKQCGGMTKQCSGMLGKLKFLLWLGQKHGSKFPEKEGVY